MSVSLVLHQSHTRLALRHPVEMSVPSKTNIFTLHKCRGVNFHTGSPHGMCCRIYNPVVFGKHPYLDILRAFGTGEKRCC